MSDAAIPIAELRCSKCGQPLRPGAQFCPACGHALAGGVEDTEVHLSQPEAQKLFIHRWGEIKQIALLYGLLLGSSLALGIYAQFDNTPWAEVVVVSIDALIIIAFAMAHRHEILPLLRRPQLDLRSAGQLVLLAIGFVVAMDLFFGLLGALGVPSARISDEYAKAGWGVGPMLLLVSVQPAVFEELAFRGVIQSTLEDIFEWRDAWIIQAALFAVLHLSPLIFPSHFVMGLCFGYLRLKSKSLYPGMVLHGSWNAVVLLQELYGS